MPWFEIKGLNSNFNNKRKSNKPSTPEMFDHPTFLLLADLFFTLFHTSLILFNLFGWLWKSLRKWHFLVIVLTFLSWGLLGIWYGLGYCPLTDWHWDILSKRGVTDLPNSFVGYVLGRFFGWDISADLVDLLTLIFALIALGFSIKVNFFARKAK